MSSRGERGWSLFAVALLFGVVAVLTEIGLFAPWIGIFAAVVGTAAVGRLPERRGARLLRAVREKAEAAVDGASGEIVRHAGDDAEGIAAAVAALIRVTDAERAMSGALELERSAILSTLLEGVVIVDDVGEFISINETARLMLNGDGDPASYRSPASLRRMVHDVRSGAVVVTDVFEHGRPRRWLQATVRPVDDERTLIVLRDVTASRQVAAMRRDFVADASHELKTPVSALLAASETILAALPNDLDSASAFAERLHSEALRLAQLVGDLLDLSRLESGPPAMDLVDLAEIVRSEVRERESTFVDAGVNIGTDLAVAMVRAEQREVALAIGNLLENARTYSDRGSAVHVRVSSEEDRAVVTVRDQGTGIPVRDLPRIFERFYRVDAARSRRSGGTGLGLAIVKHIAERHGGGVEVESELGVGSIFRFWLRSVE